MNHHYFTTAWLSRAVLYFLLTFIWSEKLVRHFRLLLTAAQVVVCRVLHIRWAPEICTCLLQEGSSCLRIVFLLRVNVLCLPFLLLLFCLPILLLHTLSLLLPSSPSPDLWLCFILTTSPQLGSDLWVQWQVGKDASLEWAASSSSTLTARAWTVLHGLLMAFPWVLAVHLSSKMASHYPSGQWTCVSGDRRSNGETFFCIIPHSKFSASLIAV